MLLVGNSGAVQLRDTHMGLVADICKDRGATCGAVSKSQISVWYNVVKC